MKIEFDREASGRWIADVPEMPGVVAYGANRSGAFHAVKRLALEVVAQQLDDAERAEARRRENECHRRFDARMRRRYEAMRAIVVAMRPCVRHKDDGPDVLVSGAVELRGDMALWWSIVEADLRGPE